MEQLAVLDRIFDNIIDTMEPDTAIYMFAAAIYDTWSSTGNDIEKNLAARLVHMWQCELENDMMDAYRLTKYDKERLEKDDHYKRWIEGRYKTYSNHKGLQRALIKLWESKYGIRLTW